MMWLAPWALAGLVAVAAPVLVHWLARHQATVLRFPTIQFLVRSSAVSVTRYRMSDPWLLAVRAGIVMAAVVALAQPVWVRPGASAARPIRAIVVDTSASLRRTMADGRAGADVAREMASAAAAGADAVITVPAERVPQGVAQAAAWLARQAAPRELVVVSDFQTGALMESDLDEVPADAGIRLVPIAVSGPVPVMSRPARGRLRVLVGPKDAARATAAEAAARATVVHKTTSEVASSGDRGNDLSGRLEVALVFPSAPEQDDLRDSAQPVDTPELFGVVADIQREWRRVAPDAEKTSGVFFAKKTPDVFSETGLAVFTDADPGSTEAAALIVAILRALGPDALDPAEREPDTLVPGVIDRWQRMPAPAAPAGRPDARNDGRWFWALALMLFGLETWMRRRPTAVQAEVSHADAA